MTALTRDVLIGFFVMAVVTVPWSVVAVVNLRVSPQVPWAIPATLGYLAAMAWYLNGRGWPASTTETRRRHFRARLPGPTRTAWALLAGSLAIVSLWLIFAATGRLASQPAPGREAAVAPQVLLAFVIVGSLVTAMGEEAGIRGFMQAPLERRFGPYVAIAISTIAFVLIHLTRGAAALLSNGLFYLAAGVVYGLLAYLTQSILPSLLLHFLGDIVTFALRSSLLRLSGPHTVLEITFSVLGAVIMAGLSIAAFRALARNAAPPRNPAGGPAG